MDSISCFCGVIILCVVQFSWLFVFPYITHENPDLSIANGSITIGWFKNYTNTNQPNISSLPKKNITTKIPLELLMTANSPVAGLTEIQYNGEVYEKKTISSMKRSIIDKKFAKTIRKCDFVNELFVTDECFPIKNPQAIQKFWKIVFSDETLHSNQVQIRNYLNSFVLHGGIITTDLLLGILSTDCLHNITHTNANMHDYYGSIRFIIENIKDYELKKFSDNHGNNLLHLILRDYYHFIIDDIIDLLNYLHDRVNIDVNQQNKYGNTPVMELIENTNELCSIITDCEEATFIAYLLDWLYDNKANFRLKNKKDQMASELIRYPEKWNIHTEQPIGKIIRPIIKRYEIEHNNEHEI